MAAVLGLAAIPLLPKTFTERMDTMKTYKADQSASTRLAVWKWTWEYVKDHPFGGGFDSYRQNKITFDLTKEEGTEGSKEIERQQTQDQARAFHSSYFELLGEQGFPGLAVWLLIQIIGLFRMEVLVRRYRNRPPDEGQWIGHLAGALQQALVVFLIGSAFVGIAYQPFVYMLIGMQIGLDTYAKRRAAEAAWRPLMAGRKPEEAGAMQPA
jgi:O-antigen ligase